MNLEGFLFKVFPAHIMTEGLQRLNSTLNGYVWGSPMILLLMGMGGIMQSIKVLRDERIKQTS